MKKYKLRYLPMADLDLIAINDKARTVDIHRIIYGRMDVRKQLEQ